MKIFSKVGAYLANNWIMVVLYALLVLGFGWILWWQLGTLTINYSLEELTTYNASNLQNIWNSPINAPFTLLTYGLTFLGNHSLILTRISAVAFGLLTLVLFYGLVRYWHGERTAILGTILFGLSAWFLHTTRLGTPDVLLFLLLALAACGTWLRAKGGAVPLLLCFLIAVCLMYVPGMIWFVLLGVIWQWKRLDKVFKSNLWAVSLGGLVLLAAIAPLGWAIYQTPELWKQVVGLPSSGWPQIFDVLRGLIQVPINLFIRGPIDPQHWLGRLPVLDAFSIAMFGLGTYLYLKYWRLKRTKLLASILVLGTVLISLGGNTSLSIIVPFVYVIVAAGTGFMLDYWYRVFPRNIFARSIGLSLLCLAVLACCWYNLRSYFVAWPNASETQQVFTVPATTVVSDKIVK